MDPAPENAVLNVSTRVSCGLAGWTHHEVEKFVMVERGCRWRWLCFGGLSPCCEFRGSCYPVSPSADALLPQRTALTSTRSWAPSTSSVWLRWLMDGRGVSSWCKERNLGEHVWRKKKLQIKWMCKGVVHLCFLGSLLPALSATVNRPGSAYRLPHVGMLAAMCSLSIYLGCRGVSWVPACLLLNIYQLFNVVFSSLESWTGLLIPHPLFSSLPLRHGVLPVTYSALVVFS